MTVLSRQWRAPWPRRRTALARLVAARRQERSGRRAYRDPFFTDPALVEDDARRMTRPER